MRNVERRRNISVALAVAAAGYLVTFASLRIGPEHEVMFGVAIASFLTVVIGLSFAVMYQLATRQRQRLLRGERLLAQWTLTDDVWSRFCALEEARTDGTKNAIRVREQRETAGVSVIITEESLMVDDDFYHLSELRELTWHETVPAHFDFHMVTHTKSSVIHWFIRVPASDSDPVAMRKIWDYFQTRLVPMAIAKRVRNVRIMRRISVALIPIGAVAAVVAKLLYGDPSTQSVALTALAIAMLTLPLGIIVGGMTHWWLTRGEGKMT
ncbi:MAG: hypothetical protein IT353_02040 [Gemmatimonadaceae bacterium]|nr:hypothetical protein [Gemmatimonadaceae bacterium]